MEIINWIKLWIELHKDKLILIIGIILIILGFILPSIHGIVEDNGLSMTSSDTDNIPTGFLINISNYNLNLTNITKASGDNSNTFIVYNGSVNLTTFQQLTNCTSFSGDVCTLGTKYLLLAGAKYRIVGLTPGSSRVRKSKIGGVSYPITNTYFIWSEYMYADVGLTQWYEGINNAYTIQSIGFDLFFTNADFLNANLSLLSYTNDTVSINISSIPLGNFTYGELRRNGLLLYNGSYNGNFTDFFLTHNTYYEYNYTTFSNVTYLTNTSIINVTTLDNPIYLINNTALEGAYNQLKITNEGLNMLVYAGLILIFAILGVWSNPIFFIGDGLIFLFMGFIDVSSTSSILPTLTLQVRALLFITFALLFIFTGVGLFILKIIDSHKKQQKNIYENFYN